MQNKDKITQRLGHQSIGTLLLRYSLPAIISMAAMSLYNIIGSVFIGHGVGALAISAMGITFPVMNLLFAFSLLIGIGGAAYLSIYLGEKDMDSAFKVLGNVAMLNIIVSILVAIVLIAVLDPLLFFFGASDKTLPYARTYMLIILLGNPIMFTMFNLNHLIRASGYPNKSMCNILVSVLVSAPLCWWFIFKIKMGIAGAATAAILSQTCGLLLVLLHFFRRDSLVFFKRGIFHFDIPVMKKIFYVGLSPCFVNLFGCLVAIFVNSALFRLEGDLGIGAFSIMNRVLLVFAMVIVGLSQGMQPIIGFNYGAGNWERVKKTLNYGLVVATIISTSGFVLAQLCPEAVANAFTDDHTLSDLAVNGLRVGMALFFVVGPQIIIQQFFQYIGLPKISIFLSTTRQLLVLIPALLVLSHYFGTWGVWASLAFSDMLAFLISAIILLVFMMRLKKNKLQVPSPTVR